MPNSSNTPSILIFDSGIGGLSVYEEIRKKIPNLHYIYAFDNEMFPYGDKSAEFLIDRVLKVINTLTNKYQLNLVVIACNTASTICLPSLREKLDIPIVGVVPAIKPASQITKNKCIGLLATKATVQRSYTLQLIQQFAQDCEVKLLGLSELALIAEKKLQGEAVDQQQLKTLLSPWLTLEKQPDTIVLGCTHYPFIKHELKMLFPRATFIDSGIAIATRVSELLNQNSNLQNVYKINLPNIVITTLNNDYVEKLIYKLKELDLKQYQVIKIKG